MKTLSLRASVATRQVAPTEIALSSTEPVRTPFLQPVRRAEKRARRQRMLSREPERPRFPRHTSLARGQTKKTEPIRTPVAFSSDPQGGLAGAFTTSPGAPIICMVTQMSKQTKAQRKRAASCLEIGELMEPRFFKALSEPNRIAILIRLAQCRTPCTVGEIAACCPVNMSVVSRHLAMLRDAGILEARKQGKEVFYSVSCSALASTLRTMADAIESCCPPTGSKQRGKGNE